MTNNRVSRITLEDRDLVPEQYDDLNEEFYGANPAEYLWRRLYLLTLYAGANDEFRRLLSEGISYEAIRIKVDLGQSTDVERWEHRSFLTMEAEVLLHHASEALFRLYFAHSKLPPCPWLECARLRTPREFKARVEEFLAGEATESEREQIAQVFLGVATKDGDTGRAEAVHVIHDLLRVLGARLLEDAGLYNSAKHGLAVIAGRTQVTLGSEDRGIIVKSDGPSVSYLERLGESGAPARWHLTTQWVSPRQAISLTSLAVTQIASLWSVARHRYTDFRSDGVEVITREALKEATTGEMAGTSPITHLRRMLYYSDRRD